MGGSVNAGIGRYIFELLKAMLELDTENRFVVFYNKNNVASQDLDTLSRHENVELVATTIRHYSWQEQVLFPRVLKKYPVDLMHFPNFNVPVWYTGPYVVTIHDMVHHKISGHKKSHYLHFQGYKYIMWKAIQRAAAIITPSEAARTEIAHFFPMSNSLTSVINEGISLEPVTNESVEKVKKQFLLSKPYFLFVGTLERKKNTNTLALGFDQFIERHGLDMDLVFAGKADVHYPEAKANILQIKHASRVVCTGFIDDATLAALFQGAYAFVSASLNEGFGLPGVEAMQFGLPILVSNIPVFNEIYDSAAIYFNGESVDDIAEKMYLVARDKQFYDQLRQKSLTRGTAFTWERAARETLEVYRRVLTTSTVPDIDVIAED